MRRTFADRLLLPLGGLLVAAAWYALTFPDAAFAFLVPYVGSAGRALLCVMQDILPCGVVLGYLLMGLGGLFVAIAIGMPAAPPAENIPDEDRCVATQPCPEPGRRTGVDQPHRCRPRAVLCAAGLAVVGSACSIRTQPGTWPVLLWLATVLMPLAAMLTIDRQRRTPFGNPFPHRWECVVLLLIVALDLLLVGHDMTHWRWAGTPDETDFFIVAQSMATGASERPLLGEAGVFMFQPVLSSLYPALFMRVFGVNVFAWKLSSAVALAASLPFAYLFIRELWNRRTAFLAALFFGSAQLAVVFAHFGYNNVQVYPILTGGLGVLAWARTRRSLLGAYLAGCIAGVGFYTYYAARAVAPLLFLLIWSCDGFPLARKARAQTAALALGLGLTILPVFSDFGSTLHNTLQVAVSGNQVGTFAAAASRLLLHWFLSLVHGLWYPEPHHFQSNPIVDPISGTLAVIGLWLCLGGWRRANGRFVAAAYILAALFVGATSPHYRPPLTRLLFLSPFTAMLAAVGADQLLRRLQGSGNTRQGLTRVAAGTLVIVSVAWNVVTVEYNVRAQHHGYGRGITSELIRMAEELPAACRLIFIQTGEDERVVDVLNEYGMTSRLVYRRAVDAQTLDVLRTTPPPFVVFTDVANPELMGALETAMAQRFPAGAWRSSAPGQRWNLRYFDVSRPDLGPAAGVLSMRPLPVGSLQASKVVG